MGPEDVGVVRSGNPVPWTRRTTGYIMQTTEGSGTSTSLISVSVDVKHHVYFSGTLAIWLSD